MTAFLPTTAIWAEGYNPALKKFIIADSKTLGMPWPSSPKDMAHFRNVTDQSLMVMGHNTYRSLPDAMKTKDALANRPMLVISRNPGFFTLCSYKRHGYMVSDLPSDSDNPESLKHFLESHASIAGKQKVSVIGGAAIIEVFGPVFDVVHITSMRDRYAGDVVAPNSSVFRDLTGVRCTKLASNANLYTFTKTGRA